MFKIGDLVKPNCFLNFSEIGRVTDVIIYGSKISYVVRFKISSIEFEESKLESAYKKK